MIGNTVSLNGYATTFVPGVGSKILRTNHIRPISTSATREKERGSRTSGGAQFVAWYWATFERNFEKFSVNLGRADENSWVLEESTDKALLMLPDLLADLVKNLRNQITEIPKSPASGSDARIVTVDGVSMAKRGATYRHTLTGFTSIHHARG